MILEFFSHHLSYQMCNGGNISLVGEYSDIAPSQFVICVMKYEYVRFLLYSKDFNIHQYYAGPKFVLNLL